MREGRCMKYATAPGLNAKPLIIALNAENCNAPSIKAHGASSEALRLIKTIAKAIPAGVEWNGTRLKRA